MRNTVALNTPYVDYGGDVFAGTNVLLQFSQPITIHLIEATPID